MTLNTTYKPAVAQGNGIIKEFSYSFNPISSSYIKVYFEIDGKWVEQKTGWSATVSDSGGVVTFLTAPTTRVSIERDIPESQPTSYTTSSGFQAKVIENSFDLLTGMIQELKDASDRSVKVEVGDNQTPEELLEEVYNKLDSATAIAGDAINAANQAQTAADNATAAVNQAEQTLTEVTNYVDLAKSDIEDTKNTAINTINSTVAQAKADINTAVSTAESNISTIVLDAEGSITNIAITEANKAIANAAQEATDMATANLNSYVDGTVKPSLQTYVDQAQENANSAATSMEQAALSATAASNYASNASASETNALSSKNAAASSATAASGSANNAKIWAEGTDAQVQALGGEKSAKGWAKASTNLDYTNITNCITEIPQDINIELNRGTLKLKAGSKVYVPNGANVYNAVTISSDMILPKNSSAKYFIFLKDNGATADTMPVDYCYTGKFEPTITHTYAIWHDTASYKIKWTGNNGSTWVAGYSFPLCVVVNNTPGTEKVSSIEQVFNGFGYVGQTVYALPGVKGLIPNGRNADGSLKNTEFSYDSVKYVTFSEGTLNEHLVCYLNYISIRNTTLEYDEKANLHWLGSKYSNEICDAGRLSIDSANSYAITSFTPKTAFHAVDYNDFKAAIDAKDSLPDQTGNANKFLKTDGTTASWADVFSAGNVGDIKYTSRTDIPNGGAWCDGALYTKAQFPDVYQMLVDGKLQSTTVTDFDNKVSANGSCGFFGLDTSNERFKVPMLKNVYLKAGQAGEMFGAESLPNIKAGDPSNQNTLSSPGNAATGQYGAAKILGNADDVSRFQIGGLAGILKRTVFDASLSSSTYKDGAKVNPDHVTYRAYVVLYASATEASVAQAAEFMTGLDGKANVALDNVASNIDYVVESYKNGENWYRRYKSGWIEQGGTANAGGTVNVTFLKAFKDTNYTAVATTLGTHGEIYAQSINKTSGTVMTIYNYGASASYKKSWYACGQGA